jgi:hypothetical protein
LVLGLKKNGRLARLSLIRDQNVWFEERTTTIRLDKTLKRKTAVADQRLGRYCLDEQGPETREHSLFIWLDGKNAGAEFRGDAETHPILIS